MNQFKSIIGAAAVMLMAAACTGGKSDNAKPASDSAETPIVKVQTVYQENVAQTSEYSATVEPFKSNNISSMTGNRIKRILVDVGSRVSTGQALVILDDVNIDQQKIQMANLKRDLRRAEELVKIGGGTQQSVDQLRSQYDTYARSLRNMQENTVLTCPISGVVTAKNFNNGDVPSGMPILVVEQIQPVKVVVNVVESELPKVKVGMPASIKFDTYGDEVFTGRVHIINPTVDPATRTFQVEVTIPNADSRVHSGMFARVTFNYGSTSSVVVPDRAIQKQTGSAVRYVYVLNANGTVSFREVTLGRRLEDRYEVTGGLAGGTTVVVSGQSRLADGAKVRIEK